MPLSYTTPTIDLTQASDNGVTRPSYPFFSKFGDADHVVFTRPMVQLSENYSPLALNTSATINGESVYAAGDSDPTDIGAQVMSFDRIYANVPAAHYDYETSSLTFPGWFEQRDPNTQAVTVQIEYEYFLVGPGQTYETVDEIPLVDDSRVTNTDGLDVSIFSGGDLYLNDGGGVLSATTPTLTDYQTAITTAAYSLVIDSKPEHYLGGIWAVVTRRVKPL